MKTVIVAVLVLLVISQSELSFSLFIYASFSISVNEAHLGDSATVLFTVFKLLAVKMLCYSD